MERGYPTELENLTAVVAATLDRRGVLRQANAGFRRIAAIDGGESAETDISRLFIQPDLATLNRAIDESTQGNYTGMLTLGDANTLTRTLQAKVSRCGDGLLLLAEYDIDDLERINEAFRKLNATNELLEFELVQANQQLKQQNAAIESLSLTDPLTGLGNRRQLDATLAIEFTRIARTGELLTAIMADIDHFKNVNDSFGHDAGDRVIKAFGAVLQAHSRAVDLVARFGGEEFVVLLPHTSLEAGLAIAERMRLTIEATLVPPMKAPVTASFGIAQAGATETAASLLQRIDRALYKAKESGRNRVVAG